MDKRGIAGTLFRTLLAGGIAAVIGAAALPATSPYIDALMYSGGAAILLGFVGLIVLFIFPEKKPQKSHATVDQRVSSRGQSGGITAHTVISPPELGV